MTVTDPDDIPTRDAHVDMITDQLDAHDDGTDTENPPPRTGEPMEYDCHRCGTPLSPRTGRSAACRTERSGVCPECRRDGVGSATFVTLTDPDAIQDDIIERLDRRQRHAVAQSTESAAAVIDEDRPAGDYAIRRTRPTELTVTCHGDVGVTAVRRLGQRYVGVGPWDVIGIDADAGRIVLLDATFGYSDTDPVDDGP